jgi:hypothetical protein
MLGERGVIRQRRGAILPRCSRIRAASRRIDVGEEAYLEHRARARR